MSRIGFIGTGHIAAPMVRHLVRKGHEITVTHRNAQVSEELHNAFGVSVSDGQDVVDQSDIVILCLRPHVAAEILTPLSFRKDQSIISVMAGISRTGLGELCAPVGDFVQMIPLGFLESGGCPLAAYGDSRCLRALFEPENPVVDVPSETALNAHFAICAMVPGLLDLMSTGANWLQEHTGDADRAEFYTAQLMTGFLNALSNTPGALAQERDALATEGTLSLQMTETLQTEGAHKALRNALSAIGRRLEKNT